MKDQGCYSNFRAFVQFVFGPGIDAQWKREIGMVRNCSQTLPILGTKQFFFDSLLYNLPVNKGLILSTHDHSTNFENCTK